MVGEKADKIQSLNQSETELLHILFKDPDFKVKEVAANLFRSEQAIRGNLTAIFKKLGVPFLEGNKRAWVVREYLEAYEYVFHREEWEAKHPSPPPPKAVAAPEIFIKPPDPIVVAQEQKPEVVVETVTKIETVYVPTYIKSKPKVVEVNHRAIGPLAFFLGLAVLALIILGLYFDELKKTSVPLKPPILYLNHFDEDLSPRLFELGTGWTYNSYLGTSDDRLVMRIGNDDWVNYMIRARVAILGCTVDQMLKWSGIGIRYSTSLNNYVQGYRWPCNRTSAINKDVEIKVKGNVITVIEDGGQPQTSGFDAKVFKRGGIVIELTGANQLDYVLVEELP